VKPALSPVTARRPVGDKSDQRQDAVHSGKEINIALSDDPIDVKFVAAISHTSSRSNPEILVDENVAKSNNLCPGNLGMTVP
jgi:hypothetical protein